jgi:hypothetical protein
VGKPYPNPLLCAGVLSSDTSGERAQPSEKDIATEPTHVTWQPHLVPLKTFRFPEIAMEIFIPRSSTKAKYQKRYPEAIRSLCEDEAHLLTYYDFPVVMHRYIRTTNAIESFFSNVRQRTDQIDTFTTEMSCLTIVWATMQDIHLPRIPIS